MNLLSEIVKASIISAATIFITLWLTSTSELEYREGSKAPYFKYPDSIAKDLEILHKNIPVKNISIVEYAIHNRTFSGFKDVTIYVNLNESKAFHLISRNLRPPKNLPNIGIEDLPNEKDGLYGFTVKSLKRTGDDYYYLSLVFEGDEAPKTSISVANQDIDLVPYKTWKDTIYTVAIAIAVYAVFLTPLAMWFFSAGERTKSRFYNRFRRMLSEGESPLSPEHTDFVMDTYIHVRDVRRPSWLMIVWRKFTSIE